MTPFTKALRLLQESKLIAQLVRNNYAQLSHSGSKEYDDFITQMCKKDAEYTSFIFVSILFIIFAKKGFGQWTDFWYEMGERIFSEDAYDPDDEPNDEDDE